MTTPNHVLHTAVIAHWATGNILFAAACGLMAALPDLIPIKETIRGVWHLYVRIHRLEWWQLFVPPYGLHLLLDYFLHDHREDAGGWLPITYVIEVLLWLGIVAYVWFAFF